MKTVNLRRFISDRIRPQTRNYRKKSRDLRGHDGTPTPRQIELLEEKVLLSANDQISEAFFLGDMSQVRTRSGYSINPGDDVDMFSFNVTAGQRVQFDLDRTSGSTLDSVLRVFNSNGSQLAINDDGAAPGETRGLESFIDHTFTSAGRHYLGVSGFGNSGYSAVTGTGDRVGSTIGAFTLTLTPIDSDVNDQISEAIGLGTILSTHQRSGTINSGNDVDMYSIDVSTGQTVQLDIDRTAGSSLDSVLRLFSSNGTQLASNDDGSAPGESFSLESYISHTFTTGGRYYVGVSNFGNSSYSAVTGSGDGTGSTTGGYNLIASTNGDANDQISEAISVGTLTATASTRSGSISPANDVDMYSFSAGRGQQVRIDVDRTSGNLDSYIRLFDSDGTQLAFNDDGAAPGESGGLDSYLQHTLVAGGTYYVGISDLANRTYNAVTGLGDSSATRTGAYRIGFSVQSVVVNSDANDQISEAQSLGAITTTRSSSGFSIGSGDDVDMFSFSVSSGDTVQFDLDRTSGSGLDSVIRLFNSNGTQLAFNDDGAAPGESSGLESYLQHTFTSGGTFYMGVSAFGNSSYSATRGTGDRIARTTGGFTLFVSPTDSDPNDQIREAINVGSTSATEVSRTGSISPSRDVDMYAFSVTAGQRVQFDLDRTSGNLDSYICVFDSSGTQLRANDDGRAPGESSSLDSFLDHTFTAGGTYYLGISDLSNRSYSAVTGLGDSTSGTRTGGYRIGFTAFADNTDPNDEIGEATSLGSLTTSGVTRSGTIGRSDVDMYAFTVTAGTTVSIDLDRTSGTLDSLIRVFDSNGAVVVRNDDGRAPGESSSRDSFIFHSFSSSGTYYIGVSDLANSLYNPMTGGSDTANTRTGNYNLIVSAATSDTNDSIAEAVNLGAMTQDRERTGYSISTATDVDMFSFTVDTDQTIGIDINRPSGSSLDSFLRLFDSAGRLLAWNDDGSAPGESFSLESYIQHTFSSSGRYYVGVSGFGNSGYNAVTGGGDTSGSIGAFTLNLKRIASTANVDPNDQLSEADNVGAITTTRTRFGGISPGSDVDMYRFTASAGQLVSFDIDRPSGSWLDSVIRVFDSTGQQIGVNDDAPGPGESSSLESFLRLRFGTSGTYYVGVSAFGNRNYNPVDGTGDRPGSTTGDYSLIITGVDDPDDQISEAISLGTLSSTITRTGQTISSGNDVDMYSFTVTTGQRVGIDIDRPSGSRFDSYLRLFDSAGNTLAVSDDARGPGETFSLESYLLHTFSTSGTYYIGVSGFGNSTYSATTGDGDRSGSSGSFSIILSSLSTPTASDDRFENNDTLATAHNFGTVRGLRFERSLVMGDAADFYRFTTVGTGGGGHYVRVNFQHAQGDVDIRLRDSTGRVLSNSTSVVNTEQVSLARLPAGTYYIEVYGYRGAFNPSYTLTLATPGGRISVLPDDTFEDNDTRATAANLGTITRTRSISHLAMRDGHDWYRFRQLGTGTSANFVGIDFLQGQGDLDLELFNSRGQFLDRSFGVSNTERVSLDRLPAGEYFIHVLGARGATNPSYSLFISPGINRVMPPIVDDAFEENDTRATATALGTLTTQRTITNLALSDAADYYSFRTNGTGAATSSVQINFDQSRGDLDLVVLNASGTVVGRSTGFTGTESVSLANQPAGEYTVLVYGYLGARNPNYSMTINPATVTPPSGRDTLYLVFDGANLSNQQLRSWAGTDWAGSVGGYLDPEGDGIRVNRFLNGRSDREAVITALIGRLQTDLTPFGITAVRRSAGSAVAGQGATTLFFGVANMRDVYHVAGDIDYGNNNRTDIAFVGDENWGSAANTALALADVALHEAGHTFGLFHVNTRVNGTLFTESMGLRYSSNQNQWLQNTSFRNQTFAEYRNHGGVRGSQNTFTTMRRNFGLSTSSPAAAQALFESTFAAEAAIPRSYITTELLSDQAMHASGDDHSDDDKTTSQPQVNLTGKVFVIQTADGTEYSIEQMLDEVVRQEQVSDSPADDFVADSSAETDAGEFELSEVTTIGAGDAALAFSNLDSLGALLDGSI